MHCRRPNVAMAVFSGVSKFPLYEELLFLLGPGATLPMTGAGDAGLAANVVGDNYLVS